MLDKLYKIIIKIFMKLKNLLAKLLNIKSSIDEVQNEIDSAIEEVQVEINEEEEIPMWERDHIDDPDFDVPKYIEVDIADPWKDYITNQIRCKNGVVKEEISVLENDLVDYAGHYGDNIWLGKRVGEGYVVIVGPNYHFNDKNIYTVIYVKVYNSEENSYIGRY